MANYNLVITSAGLAAARNVAAAGYKINIEQVKIGDLLVNPDSAESLTDVVGNVVFDSDDWVENIRDILTVQLTGSSGAQFRVYLDGKYGDFTMGNIGLFITDPVTNMRVMFSIGCLNTTIEKYMKTNENAGNSFKFYLNTQLSNVANILNMETNILNEGYIPTVATEVELPTYGTQDSNVYQLLNYMNTGQIALAVAGESQWEYIQPSTNSIFAKASDFDSNVLEGNTVYWDGATQKYKNGDGTDTSKGVLGIRKGNNIIFGGYVINPGAYSAGTRYYADGGSKAGKLTTGQTLIYVGEAITNDILMLGLDTRSHATTSKYGVVMTATASEVNAGANNSKYVTPLDLATYYPNRGKDETITGNWTFTHLVNMSGNVTVNSGATMDLEGNLSVGGTTTLGDNVVIASGKNLSVGGTLSVTGTTNMSSFSTTGDGSIGGNLTLTGNETIGGTLDVTGDTTLKKLTANNTAINGTLSTTGKATLNSLGVTNNATVGGTLGVTGATTIGGALGVTGKLTAGQAQFNNAVTMGSTLGVDGIATFGNNVSINGTLGVTGVTNMTSLTTSGSTTVQGTLTSSGNGIFSGTTYTAGGTWTFSNTINGTSLRALWADLAELYESDSIYEPGTLIQFGGTGDITIATTEVNGIISTNPGLVIGDSESPFAQPVACVGKVPTLVIGTIKKNDKIVLSENPGVARKYDAKKDKDKVIIGRALEDKNTDGIEKVNCVTRIYL